MLKRIALLLLGLLIIFAALFLLPDFHLLQGETAVDSQASTSSYRQAGAQGTLPSAQTVDLYVEAPARLEPDLTRTLAEALAANPYIGELRLQEAPPAPATGSVLVVTVTEPDTLFWSPFYTSAALTAEVAYASDGAVAWLEEEVVVFENTEGSPPLAVRMEATHQFDGSAYGLVSRPGYTSYLANQIAEQINTALADTLANQPPPE